MSGPRSFVFTEAEVMGLYMILKDREERLDYTISKLLNRLERVVHLDQLFSQKLLLCTGGGLRPASPVDLIRPGNRVDDLGGQYRFRG